MKTCSRCKETKSLEEFQRNRTRHDGLSERCRACKSIEDAALRKRKREAKIAEANKKVCVRCGESKDRSEFYQSLRHADGRYPKCKECKKAAARIKADERKAIIRRQSLFKVPQKPRDWRQYDEPDRRTESDNEALRLMTVDEIIAEVRRRNAA